MATRAAHAARHRRGRLDRAGRAVARLPPASFFTVSAVFHYLGPSLAFLLFAHVSVLGVAWLRIVSAAVVFALWRRPWRRWRQAARRERQVLLALGALLAAMNSLFYLAVDRLPLSTVGAIEFLGTVILAAAGARSRRNLVALVLAVGGVAALTDVRLADEPLGFAFAFANCAGFMGYVVLGHRIATTGRAEPGARVEPMSGIDRLAMSMLVAAVVATPLGIGGALPAFTHPRWLLWGIGVGICSSVIPYVTDQLAMARLPRATFALMLALLPATATVLGLLVLGQVPTPQDLLGVGLVVAGVAVHHPAPAPSRADPARPPCLAQRWRRPVRLELTAWRSAARMHRPRETLRMAYDVELADRIRAVVQAEPGLTERRMFGGLAFLIRGNMAVSASGQGGLLLRVDPAEAESLVSEPQVRRFEMRGRQMDGWLRVAAEVVQDDDGLRAWVRHGVTYARSLPPK